MFLVDLIYNFVGVRFDYFLLYIYSEDYYKYMYLFVKICFSIFKYVIQIKFYVQLGYYGVLCFVGDILGLLLNVDKY